MAYDEHGAGQMSGATIRRASSIHLREEADGAALLVDDRTLTAAHINKSACILFQALDRPRTLGDLADILAGTAKCSASEAFLPVVKLVEQAVGLGWLEVQGDSLNNGRPESER